jgi:hypothetical protein
MPDNDVDMSVLDKLIEITRQQRQLDDYRSRAEARKDKVDAAVYRRVVDDYNKRDAGLEKDAQPLKAQARVEYEKLRALFKDVNQREEQARYDKQELEFRHEVGEMDAAQLAAQLKAPSAILEKCQSELAGLEKQKARFLEAFDEDELDRPSAAAPAEPEPPVTRLAEAVAAARQAPEFAADVTMMAPLPDVTMPPSAAVVPPPPPAPPAPAPSKSAPTATSVDPAEEYTFVLPEGVLIGDGKQEYRLTAVNYLGRADDNQIRITSNGVSRKHAMITADKTSFIVKDLKSQNGTFVNDDQIEERALKDGDVIKLGEARLVFKLTRKGA